MSPKRTNYNVEPVVYCSRCYSLNIIHEDIIGADCCGKCGCSDVKTTSIEEWEKLYKNRYGHNFITDEGNVKKSPIFQVSISRLKTIVCDNPQWRELCKKLYPRFPEGIGKADSIVLLFAKLHEDNRIDDLRMELINSK